MPTFTPIAGRSARDINFENTVRERERRMNEGLLNPGMPRVNQAPGWDALWGGLDRNAEDAAAQGKSFRVNYSGGPMATPLKSLQRAVTPAGELDPDDATNYQLKRAVLDRTLNDNFAAKWGQRTALNDADRARDPGVQLFEDTRRRERAAGDAAAADTIAADSYRRLEPTRMLQRRESRIGAAEMLPFNEKIIQAQVRNSGVLDTNDARRDVAATNAQGRTGAAAINSLARTAGAQTFGDPTQEARLSDATRAILPNVPGQADGLRPLPPEWDFNLIVEKFGGNAQAADEWLRLNGYRR